MKFALPLIVCVIIGTFLYKGLANDPSYIASPLIGKPAPSFSLPVLGVDGNDFTPEQMKGKVWMLNIWATWCASCRVEHPLLVDLARQGIVDIVGLNYKDKDDLATQWLNDLGDPYVLTAVDQSGRIGIDWGFYGAPETFVIDKAGIVRYKHVGPIAPADLQNTLLPLVAELKAAS